MEVFDEGTRELDSSILPWDGYKYQVLAVLSMVTNVCLQLIFLDKGIDQMRTVLQVGTVSGMIQGGGD